MSEDGWRQQLRGPGPLALALAAGAWIVLLLVVLFSDRTPSGLAKPVPSPPVTQPFDSRLQTGSEDLPLDHPRVRRTASEYEPEQIHITLAGSQAIAVSWSTGNASIHYGPDAATRPAASTGAEQSQASQDYGTCKSQDKALHVFCLLKPELGERHHLS